MSQRQSSPLQPSAVFEASRYNIDRQAGQSLLRKSSGTSLSVASQNRSGGPSLPQRNASNYAEPQSPNHFVQNSNSNNILNSKNNGNQYQNNTDSNFNQNNSQNIGSLDNNSSSASRLQGGNSESKGLTLLANGSRAKKVYIYTGVDSQNPGMVPITSIGLNKSANGDASTSPNVGRSASKGILKVQRKSQLESNSIDDSAAVLSNSGSQAGLPRFEQPSPISAGSNGSAAPRSLTPIRAYTPNKQQTGNPNSIIKPDLKNSQLDSSSNLRTPQRYQDRSTSPINSNQKEADQVRLEPREDPFVSQQQQMKNQLGVSSARKRPIVQSSVLYPLKEEETEEREDPSQGKRANSAISTQQKQDKSPSTRNNSQPVILVNDKIPFRIGTAKGVDGARGSESSPKSKSIFYSIDEGGSTSPGGTVLSNSTNTSSNSDADAHKFVHTQSYLKRRFQNKTESLNLQNDEISIPPNQLIPPKTESYVSPSASGLQPQLRLPQKFSSPKLNIHPKSPQPQQQLQTQQQLWQPQQSLQPKYQPQYKLQQPNSQQKNSAPNNQVHKQPEFWLSDEDELNFSEDNAYYQDSVKPFSPQNFVQKGGSQEQQFSPNTQSRKIGLNGSNIHYNQPQFLDSESDFDSNIPEKYVPAHVRNPSSQNPRRPKKQWVPNSYYPLKKEVKKRPSGLSASRDYSSNNNFPLINDKIVTDPGALYSNQNFQRANMQRQQNQGRALDLLDEQDRMIDKIIQKYKSRAQFEEDQIKQKLSQLEKDRDCLAQLKQQEHKLSQMRVNLHSNVDPYNNSNNNGDPQFYNQDIGLTMPLRQQQPNYRYPQSTTNQRDIDFLENMIATQSSSPIKNRNYPSYSLHSLQEQNRKRSYSLAQPY